MHWKKTISMKSIKRRLWVFCFSVWKLRKLKEASQIEWSMKLKKLLLLIVPLFFFHKRKCKKKGKHIQYDSLCIYSSLCILIELEGKHEGLIKRKGKASLTWYLHVIFFTCYEKITRKLIQVRFVTIACTYACT